MKKTFAILLSVLLIIGTVISSGAFSVSAADDVYSVIGSSKKIFWSPFDAEDKTTEMTYDPRVGLYKYMLYDVEPENDIIIQVIKNHSTNGVVSGDTVITFDVIRECDILVTYDAVAGTTDVFGEGIRETIDAQSVMISGNCFRNYENNHDWNWQAKPVKMTQTSAGVWEYTCKNVYACEDYHVDIGASRSGERHMFSCSFGSVEEGISPTGVELDAVFSLTNTNGFTFCVPENGSDIHFKLDLTGFSYKYRSRNPMGAKVTITVTPPDEPEGDYYGVKELYSKGDEAGYFQDSYSPELPMTYNEKTGMYELTVYGFQPKSDIDLVVVKNHNKIIGDPANNNEPFKFDVSSACDLTIAFDPNTNNLEVSYDLPDKPDGDIYTVAMVNYDFSLKSGEVPMSYNKKTGLYELTAFDVLLPSDELFLTVKKNHTETFGSPDVHYQPVYLYISDPCDLTVTFDPVNEIVNVYGECVSVLNSNGIWDVTAVGNGQGSFINGDVFDDSNRLEYTTKGIWEVTYENVPANDNYEVLFALNNEDELTDDTCYFGAALTIEYPIGEETNVIFNNQPIRFRVPKDNSTVTFRLDLWDFDYNKNRNAKLTIIVDPYEPDEDVYGILVVNTGFYPDPDEVMMTYNEDTGLYELFAENVEPQTIEFYLMKNHKICCGDPESGNKYPYKIEVQETCDVVITFDPLTESLKAVGDGIYPTPYFYAYSVIAVGNGEDTYLNGANWDPCDVSNAMQEISDGIWELTMTDIYAYDNYNLKFAVNSVDENGDPYGNPWRHNFGVEQEKLYPSGQEIEAEYNGSNCIFSVPQDGSTVRLRLDLRDFNYKTKQGAKLMIIITPPGEPAPTVIGDVNGDNIVDILDAVLIQKYAVDKVTFNSVQMLTADVNGDKRVDILDATEIQKRAVT